MRRLLAALLTIAACHGGAAAPVTGEARAAAWREDLAALDAALALHPGRYARTPRPVQDAARAALDGQLATLDDAHATVALMRFAALLGDSHTGVYAPRDTLYPVRFLGFEDGIFVAGTAPDQAWALGKQVATIDGRPLADALAALTPLVGADNQPHLDHELPSLLENPVVLAGADVGPAERLTIGLVGEPRALVVAAGRSVVIAPPATLPLHLQGPTQLAYWNQYVAADRLVYIQYNACRDDARAMQFARFAAETLAFIDGHAVDRVVVDLRSNEGGDSRIIEPLVAGLAARTVPVYALIGRATFSSGVLAATALAARAHATLVGGPTGGNPNSYGEVLRFELPRSHLGGQRSSKRFADAAHPGDTVPPDLAVHVRAADWFAGRDPALAAVLAAPRAP